VDAIFKAGPVLVAFAGLDRELAGRPHPFLGAGNLHGSLIGGGTEESTIPDRCVFAVERRTLPGESLDIVEAEVGALLDRCRRADPDLTVSARTTLAREPFQTPAGASIVTVLQDASRQVTRQSPVVPVSYWADSAFIAAAGIPTVLYGPAGDGAHADTEWVSLAATRTCASVLFTLAQGFCA
jgi:acetylornithine deacetylase